MKYLLTILFFTFITVVAAQDYCMTTPVGYGHNTTGGAGGTIKTVKTVS
jgi:hypothetical protein